MEGIGVERFQTPVDFYLMVPTATGAIIAVLLTNVPLTVFFALTFAVLVGLMTGEGLMVIYTLAGSLAAIYALDQYRERSVVTRAGLIIGLVNVAIALGYQLFSMEAGIRLVALCPAFGRRTREWNAGRHVGVPAAPDPGVLVPDHH